MIKPIHVPFILGSVFILSNVHSEEIIPSPNLVVPPLSPNPGSAEEIKADELRKLAKQDPEAAAQEVKKLKEGNYKQWAFNRIATEYAKKDSAKAESWLEESKNTENYNPALAGIAVIKGSKNYQKSIQWAKDLAGDSKGWALAGIVLGNFKESSEELKSWGNDEKIKINEYGEKIWNLNPNYSVVWTINASKKMAETMLSVLEQLPVSLFRNQYINLVFTAWHQTDRDKAERWLESLQEPALKDQLKKVIKVTQQFQKQQDAVQSSNNPQQNP